MNKKQNRQLSEDAMCYASLSGWGAHWTGAGYFKTSPLMEVVERCVL